ncbi:hypothetical protein [Streptomyces mayonensis]|uniref:hypothetical protein n=1 Tax=Streptomyces mayonensis TaxID=2750816 RepID=UPI001C1E6C88|nr:hypothetical protein [Streptomyces sp. A108]MBU6531499.1 hypothetical protein [Streptomyces sp. A108]
MDALLPYVILAGGLAAVLGLFIWLASRIRRRGLSGGAASGALAAYEEAFRVTAHQAHVEVRAQADRRAPLPSPDGHGGRSPDSGAEGGTGTRRVVRKGPRRSRRGPGSWFGPSRRRRRARVGSVPSDSGPDPASS